MRSFFVVVFVMVQYTMEQRVFIVRSYLETHSSAVISSSVPRSKSTEQNEHLEKREKIPRPWYKFEQEFEKLCARKTILMLSKKS